MQGLAYLAACRDQWLRPINHVNISFAPSHRERFHALACYLVCKYPVPLSLVDAWLDDDEWGAKGRRWFMHVADGRNLRDAPDLPFPLTRRMAHHALLAPSSLNMLQAMRWGQLVALGVSPELASAAAASLLGRPWPDESFCLRIGQFLAAHPGLSTTRVTPMVDFLHARRFGGRGLTALPSYNVAAKALATLEREVLAWHQELARCASVPDLAWPSCGIEGMEPFHAPGGRTWCIVELTDANALRTEGATLRHCVSSYAQWAVKGSCAIYSLRTDEPAGLPCVTIQVNLADRRIVQARGHANSLPTKEAWSAIRRWVEAEGLAIASGVT